VLGKTHLLEVKTYPAATTVQMHISVKVSGFGSVYASDLEMA